MYAPPFTQLVRSNEGHRNGLSVVLHHKIAFGYFTYETGKVFFPSKFLYLKIMRLKQPQNHLITEGQIVKKTVSKSQCKYLKKVLSTPITIGIEVEMTRILCSASKFELEIKLGYDLIIYRSQNQKENYLGQSSKSMSNQWFLLDKIQKQFSSYITTLSILHLLPTLLQN